MQERDGHHPIGVAVLLLLSLALAACGGAAEPRRGGTVTVGAEQEPAGFNPNTSKDALFWLTQIVSGVYPSVFHVRPDGTVELDRDLMESAELTSGPPQTVVYKIEKQAVWSDGAPISADDFVYAWQNQNGSDKTVDAVSLNGYEDIATVTGSDGGKTVTVVFNKPFSDWRALFRGLLPAHTMRALPGGWNHGLDQPPTFSGGPFRVKNFVRGQSLTLVRNDRYWGGPARLDAVIFRFLKDAAVGPDALGNREVDVLYPQPQLDLLQRLRRIPGTTVQTSFGLNFELLAFNLRNDYLRDVRVRRAIAKAIDRADLVRRTVGQFHPAAAVLNNRVWLPGQPPYRDHGRLAGYASVDVAGARTLLEDAGFRPDRDGIYVRHGKRLSLTLSTTAGNPLREDQAVLIQDQLKAAGIDVRPESIPANVLFGERLPTGNFDMVNASLVGSPFVVGVTAARYASSSNFNVSKYSSPEVDRLLDEAEAEFDGARYAELTNQVDELLWQDLPNLPLYQRPALLAVAEGVENVRDNPWGPGPTWNIHEWAVRRR